MVSMQLSHEPNVKHFTQGAIMSGEARAKPDPSRLSHSRRTTAVKVSADDMSTADGPAADHSIEEAGLLLRFFVFGFPAKEKARRSDRRARQEDFLSISQFFTQFRTENRYTLFLELLGDQAASTAFGSTIS